MTLPNGMTVVLLPDHRSPVVSFYNWVRVGSADESDEEAGLAHVLEHMLFKGTERRGVGEIAQEIEGCGGDVNAFTSFDTTVYYVTVASRFFDEGLDVLADATLNSIIDPKELALEKEVILEEIKRGEDSVGNQLSQKMFEEAFRDHPYRRPVIGYRRTVADATRDEVWDFYQRWYYPANMVLIAAGDFDLKTAKAKVRKAFGGGKKRAPRRRPRAREKIQTRMRTGHLTRDAQESFFDLGFRIPGIRHKDVPALDLLSVALGQGSLGRLAWRLRRQQRVVTSIHAYAYTPRDPGLFFVSGTAALDRGADSVEAAIRETFQVLSDPINEDELERARTSIEGDAVYELETVQGLARKAGFFETVAGSLELEDAYYEGIRRADPAALHRVAQKYLRPETLTLYTMAPEGASAPSTPDVRSWVKKAYKDATQPPRRRKRATRSGEIKTTLANGIRLIMREDSAVPILSLRAVMLGGLRLETQQTNGLSNLVARLQSKGTQQRSYSQILQKMDSFAGGLNGFAGYNSFGVRLDTLSKFAGEALEIFADVLRNPTFDARELEIDRGEILEAIKSMEDQLGSYVMRLFTRTLYQKHPYRMSLLGTPEGVAGYQSEDLKRFYDERAVPENLVISMVGDFDAARMEDQLSRLLGDWKAGEKFVLPSVGLDAPPTEPREEVLIKQKEQAHLVVGFPGVRLDDEDRHALELLSSILAGQGGRLFLELRDREALAYTVTAFSQEAVDPGYFAVYIATDPKKLDRATEGIRREIEKVKEHGVTRDELARNARQLAGSYEIDLQRASARAASLAFNELYGLGHDYYRQYPKDVLAVTRDQVVAAAERYLNFDRAVWAIIRPELAARDAA